MCLWILYQVVNGGAEGADEEIVVRTVLCSMQEDTWLRLLSTSRCYCVYHLNSAFHNYYFLRFPFPRLGASGKSVPNYAFYDYRFSTSHSQERGNMINAKDCQTALITVDFSLIPALPFSRGATCSHCPTYVQWINPFASIGALRPCGSGSTVRAAHLGTRSFSHSREW